jgi:hypothetical protein
LIVKKYSIFFNLGKYSSAVTCPYHRNIEEFIQLFQAVPSPDEVFIRQLRVQQVKAEAEEQKGFTRVISIQ